MAPKSSPNRSRSFPAYWDSRRILPGPPLSEETVVTTLLAQNITVGIGISQGAVFTDILFREEGTRGLIWVDRSAIGSEVRNTRFDMIWVSPALLHNQELPDCLFDWYDSILQTALERNRHVKKSQALAIASTNLERIFGIPIDAVGGDRVAYRGGDIFDLGSKVVAVVSRRGHRNDVF